MHGSDEVKCERCAKMCALAYGPDDYDALSGWMERHHHRCAPVTGAALDEARDIERQRFELARQRDDRAATSTTCARCHHAFTARPDGFVDEALDNEIAEHRERCFVVGQNIRWQADPNSWADGAVLSLSESLAIVKVWAVSREWTAFYACPLVGQTRGVARVDIRRIPRPGQEVSRDGTWRCQGRTAGSQCSETMLADGKPYPMGWRCSKHDACTTYVGDGDWCAFCTIGPSKHRKASKSIVPLDDMLADELDTKYDGVTLRDLLLQDALIRRDSQIRHAWFVIQDCKWTDTQRAAISAHWSAQLRARVQASSEQERCRVRVELQCEEENEW